MFEGKCAPKEMMGFSSSVSQEDSLTLGPCEGNHTKRLPSALGGQG